MKNGIFIIGIIAVILVLLLVNCNKVSPRVPDSTDYYIAGIIDNAYKDTTLLPSYGYQGRNITFCLVFTNNSSHTIFIPIQNNMYGVNNYKSQLKIYYHGKPVSSRTSVEDSCEIRPKGKLRVHVSLFYNGITQCGFTGREQLTTIIKGLKMVYKPEPGDGRYSGYPPVRKIHLLPIHPILIYLPEEFPLSDFC